ncbi:MAG: hypothetical protein K9W43_07735 [Candidatus Thorarchaeota archaeon]|nr:hypothetical protein [Candidatus Thorarchaeota archaeon]
MNKRGSMILCVMLSFIMLLAPITTHAAVPGKTYSFSVHWLEQVYQENNGPVVNSDVTGEFQIHVFNITSTGGNDLIYYNFKGWNFVGIPVYTDHNDSVAFQDNKVYWTLTTFDSNGNNRSETTSLVVSPVPHFTHPGRFLFVNPIWSTHDTNWDQAINDTKFNPTVDQSTFTYSASDGAFSFSFAVNIEDVTEELNGTLTYSLSVSYDSDGVLSQYQFMMHRLLHRANFSSDYTVMNRINRVASVGVSSPLNLDASVPVMALAIIVPVSIIVGLLIGKKVFG